jgi:hypothetical protein
MMPDLEQVTPLTVATITQLKVPELAYVWTEFFWEELWPSPKSQE